MTDQEIMARLVKNEQDIIKLKDKVHELRAEIDWLKRQNEIKG